MEQFCFQWKEKNVLKKWKKKRKKWKVQGHNVNITLLLLKNNCGYLKDKRGNGWNEREILNSKIFCTIILNQENCWYKKTLLIWIFIFHIICNTNNKRKFMIKLFKVTLFFDSWIIECIVKSEKLHFWQHKLF